MKKNILKTAVISITLCTMLSLFFSCASVENVEKKDDSSKFIESFFSIYEKEGVGKALDNAFQSNSYVPKPSSMDTVRIRLIDATNLIGSYDGYEIIGKRAIGNSLVNYICLVKYDMQPLRFNFILYKAKDKWMLQNFQFDSSAFIDEVADMSKFYYGKKDGK